jgi:hypothetical protein
VSKEEGKHIAQKLKALFIEASAKTNVNVNEVFFELVRTISQWREAHPDQAPPVLNVKKKKSTCIIL